MVFNEVISGSLHYMTAPNITTNHAFTTRYGGVSEGDFSSLNLALNRGDDEKKVNENYVIMSRELGITPNAIVCSQQVHGAVIRTVSNADTGSLYSVGDRTEADAMITSAPGIALMVFTADCVPILLHDPVRHAVAAVHAGWRGTVSDITGKTVAEMIISLGCLPCNIKAAIGPCISKCCFETGSEVPDAVYKILNDSSSEFITPLDRTSKYLVDLKGINHSLLLRAGIPSDNIAVSDECTMCKHDKYWSHRKTGGLRGSQAAFIILNGDFSC